MHSSQNSRKSPNSQVAPNAFVAAATGNAGTATGTAAAAALAAPFALPRRRWFAAAASLAAAAIAPSFAPSSAPSALLAPDAAGASRYTWTGAAGDNNGANAANWTASANTAGIDQFYISGLNTIRLPDDYTLQLSARVTSGVNGTGDGSWDRYYDSTDAANEFSSRHTQFYDYAGLIYDGAGVAQTTLITGGTIDTGVSPGRFGYAIMVHSSASNLRIESKLTGSGNIAIWTQGPEGGDNNTVNSVTGVCRSLWLACDASEWTGTVFVSGNDRPFSVGAPNVALTKIGAGATVEFSWSYESERSRLFFLGNTDFQATVLPGNRTNSNAGWLTVATGADDVVHIHNATITYNTLIALSGTLAIGDAGSFGGDGVALYGATLQFTTPDMTIPASVEGKAKTITLNAVGGVICVDRAAGFNADGEWVSTGDPITVTYAGTWSGGYEFRKTGDGTLRLTGANNTTIVAPSSYNIVGGTLEFVGTFTPTYEKLITGTGRLVLSGGSGTPELKPKYANTFSGVFETYTHRIWGENFTSPYANSFGTADVVIHGKMTGAGGQAGISAPANTLLYNDFFIEGIGWPDSSGAAFYGAIRLNGFNSSTTGDIWLAGTVTASANATIGNTSAYGTQRIAGGIAAAPDVTLSFATSNATGTSLTATSRAIYLTGVNPDFLGTLNIPAGTHYIGDGSTGGRASLPNAAAITIGGALVVSNVLAVYPPDFSSVPAQNVVADAPRYDVIGADITGSGTFTKQGAGTVYYTGSAVAYANGTGIYVDAGNFVLGLPEGASESAAGVAPAVARMKLDGNDHASLGSEGGTVSVLDAASSSIISKYTAVPAAAAVAGEDYTVVTTLNKGGVLQFEIAPLIAQHVSAGTYALVKITGTGKPAAGNLDTSWIIAQTIGDFRGGTPTLTADAAGVISLVLATDPALDLAYAGPGSGTWSAGSASASNFQNATGAATAQKFYNGDSVVFDNTAGAGAKTVTVSGTVMPSAILVDTPAATDSYTITSGTIADASDAFPTVLTKTGRGTLTLSPTAYNATGGIVIRGGVLVGNESIDKQTNLPISISGTYDTADGAWAPGATLLYKGALYLNGDANLLGPNSSHNAFSANQDKITLNPGGVFFHGGHGGVGDLTFNGGMLFVGANTWGNGGLLVAGIFKNAVRSIVYATANDPATGAAIGTAADPVVSTIASLETGKGMMIVGNDASMPNVEFNVAEGARLDVFAPLTYNAYNGRTNGVEKTGAGVLVLEPRAYGNELANYATFDPYTAPFTTATNLFNGAISVYGGTVIIRGAHSANGAVTVINAGSVLQFEDGGSLKTGITYTIGDGAALAFNLDTTTVTFAETVTGGGGLVKDGAGILIFNTQGKFTYTGGTVINGGVLRISSNGTSANAASYFANVAGNDITINAGGNIEFTASDPFGGANYKAVSFKLIVNAGGLVHFKEPAGNGVWLYDTILNGGELRTYSQTGSWGASFMTTITAAGDGVTSYIAANDAHTATADFNYKLSFNGASNGTVSLRAEPGATLDISVPVRDQASSGGSQASTLIIGGGGTVRVRAPIQSLTNVFTMRVEDAGTVLELAEANGTIAAAGNAIALYLGEDTSLAFDKTGMAAFIYGGTISGEGGVWVKGGEVVFNAAKTYSGETLIGATGGGTATLRLTTAGTIANTSGITLATNTAKFDISGVSTTATVKAINAEDTFSSATIVLGTKTLEVGSGEFYGVITGGAGSALVKTGGGTLVLGGSAANAQAATNVNAGVLAFEAVSVLGAASAKVTVAGGATLRFDGADALAPGTVPSLDGKLAVTGTVATPSVFNTGGAAFVLGGISGTGTSALTVAGGIGADAAAGAAIVLGDYAGAVSFSPAAAVVLSHAAQVGALSGASSIALGDALTGASVAAGARSAGVTTLGVAGAVSGVVFNLTLTGGGGVAEGADLLVLGGASASAVTTFGAGNTLALSRAGGFALGTYPLFSTAGTLALAEGANLAGGVTLNGDVLTGRERARVRLLNAGKTLAVQFYLSEASLVWAGGSGANQHVWNLDSQNAPWLTTAGGDSPFDANDLAFFAGTGSADVTVGADITVGVLNITAGAYAFAPVSANAPVRLTGVASTTAGVNGATGALEILPANPAAGDTAAAVFAAGVTLDFAGGIVAGGGATLALADASAPTSATALTLGAAAAGVNSAATLRYDASTGTGVLAGAADITVRAGGAAIAVPNADATLDITRRITGAGVLEKTGYGALLLSNTANDFAALRVTAGTVGFADTAALGAAGSTVTLGAATLWNTAAATAAADLTNRLAVAAAGAALKGAFVLGNVTGTASTTLTNTGTGTVAIGNYSGAIDGGSWLITAGSTIGSLGALSAANGVTAGSRFAITSTGATAGASFGGVGATGTATLSGATLAVRATALASDIFTHTGAGALSIGAGLTLDFATWAPGYSPDATGAYTPLLSASGFANSTGTALAGGTVIGDGYRSGDVKITIAGAHPNSHQRVAVSLDAAGTALLVTLSNVNANLVWDGGANGLLTTFNAWDTAGTNETNTVWFSAYNGARIPVEDGGLAELFYEGDNVFFDETGDQSAAVTLAAGSTAGALTTGNVTFWRSVDADGDEPVAYHLNGVKLDAAASHLLVEGAGVSVVFDNAAAFKGATITGAGATATFNAALTLGADGATVTAGGALVLGADATLAVSGTSATRLTLGGTSGAAGANTAGTLVSLAASRSIATRFAIGGDGVFDVRDATGGADALLTLATGGGLEGGANALVIKRGAGVLRVNAGGATYLGATRVEAGRVQFSGAAGTLNALGDGAITVLAGAFLEPVAAGTLANTLAGAGELDFAQTGTLVLSGANTAFTGTVRVGRGTVSVAAASALGTAGVILGGADYAGALALTATLDLGSRALTLAGTHGGEVRVTGTGSAVTYGGALATIGTGALALVVADGATLTLTHAAADGFAPAVSVGTTGTGNGGVVTLTDLGALGGGALTLNSGTVRLTTGGAFANVLTGAGGKLLADGAGVVLALTNSASDYAASGRIAAANGATLEVAGATLGSARVVLGDGGTAGALRVTAGSGSVSLPNAFEVPAGGAGTLAVTAGAAYSDTLTLRGALTGGGSLVKSGGGTLAFAATADSGAFAGAFTVAAGTVSLTSPSGSLVNLPGATGGVTLGTASDAATLTAGGVTPFSLAHNITVGAAGATIEVGVGQTLTLSGALAGTGALAKTGGGELILTGAAKTLAGAVAVARGTLNVTVAEGLAQSAGVSVAAGAVFTSTYSQTFRALDVARGATFALTGGSGTAGRVTATAGAVLTFRESVSSVGDILLNNGAELVIAAGLAPTSTEEAPVQYALNIDAAGTVTFNTGTRLVTDADGALRATTIEFASAGIEIEVNRASRGERFVIASAQNFVLYNSQSVGALLTVTDRGEAVPGVITESEYLARNFDIEAGATPGDYSRLVLTTGLVWNSATAASAHGFFNIAAGDRFTIGAVDILTPLSDNAAVVAAGGGMGGWDGRSLIKTGAGELVLAVPNSYTGSTTVREGVLTLRDVAATGASGDVAAGSPALTVGDTAANASQSLLRLDITAASAVFAKVISGRGSVEKVNANDLTLTAAQSYFGVTTLAAGRLLLSGAGSIESSAKLVIADGATFSVANYGAAAGATATVRGLEGTADARIELGSRNLAVGQTGGDGTPQLDGSVDGAGAGAFAGVLTGSGALIKRGTGELLLTGTGSHTGGILFQEGALRLGSNAAIGDLAAGAKLWHESAGALYLEPGVAIANGLAFEMSAERTVMVEGAGNTASVSGTLTGYGTGAWGFVKNGGGTLSLTNSAALATYTGSVEIRGGALEVRTATWKNELYGTGVLRVVLPAASSVFAFTAAAGNQFAGTLELPKGRVTLSDATESALSTATLKLGADATAVIGTAGDAAAANADPANATGVITREIGALATNGGALEFAASPVTPAALLRVGVLDLTGGATIRLGGLAAALSVPANMAQNLFDYSSPDADHEQQLISAGSVIGADATLVWDPARTPAHERALAGGKAVFGYTGRVETTGSAAGLILGYGLLSVSSDSSSVTLNADTATAPQPALYAKLTGAGGFIFTGNAATAADPAQTLLVGNDASDYAGGTTVRNVRLVLASAAALGERASLRLENAAVLDAAGYPLAVTTLNGAAGTALVIEGGLTVGGTTNASAFAGVIDGALPAASLTLEGGSALTLSGANTYAGGTRVPAGALALAGAGDIAASAGLVIGADSGLLAGGAATGASAPASFDISGVTAGRVVVVRQLEGAFATSTLNLGSRSLQIGVTGGATGEDSLFAGKISGASGTLVKEGAGALRLTGANSFGGSGGGIQFNAGVLSAGSNTALGAGAVTHASTGALVLDGGLTLANRFVVELDDAREFLVEDGVATLTGVIGTTGGGAGGLLKTGAGELVLANANALDALAAGGGALWVAGGVVEIRSARLDTPLRGAGALRVRLAARDTAFALGAGVGGEFTGVVEIARGSLDLDTAATDALARATLRLEGGTVPDAVALVTAGTTGALGALELDGGALRFDVSTYTPSAVLGVGDLAVTAAGGVIQINLDAPAGAVSDGSTGLFDLWAGSAAGAKQLVSATGTVTGSAADLRLTTHSGVSLVAAAGAVRPLVESGVTVGSLEFGYEAELRADAAAGANGIWLAYLLRSVTAAAGAVVHLDASASADPRLTAALRGTGGFAFGGAAGQNIILSGGGDYTGATTLADGVAVTAGADAPFGATALLTLGADAKFDLGGHAQTVGGLAGASATARVILGAGAALTVAATAADSVFAGILTGAGDLVKTGARTLTLSGASDYTGETRISGGALVVTGKLGSTAGGAENNHTGAVVFSNGAALRLEPAAGVEQTISGALSGDGSLVVAGGGVVVLATAAGAANTHTANTVLAGTLAVASDAALGDTSEASNTLAAGATLALTGAAGTVYAKGWTLAADASGVGAFAVVDVENAVAFAGSFTGDGSLAKTGAGALTLSGASDYAGDTLVLGGSLVITGDEAVGGGVNTLDGGALELGAGDYAKDWRVGAAGGEIIVRGGGSTVAFAGDIGAGAGGAGALVKSGAGVLEINGAVSVALTVSDGALGGTGSVAEVTFAAGTVVQPGGDGSVGALTLGSDAAGAAPVVLNAVTLRLDLANGAASDRIVVAGDAVFGADGLRNTLDLTDLSGPGTNWADGSYTFLTAGGTLTTGDLRDTLFLYAGELVNTEQTRRRAFVEQSGSTLTLKTYAEAKIELSWDGAGETDRWSAGTGQNWREDAGSGRGFANGDTVLFPASATNRRVTVVGAVEVAEMVVEGSGYEFNIGSITGTNDYDNGGDAGTLLVKPGASVVFNNDIAFEGGITVEGTATFARGVRTGERTVADGAAVFDGAAPLVITATGNAVLTNNTTLGAARVENDGALTLDITAAGDNGYAGDITGAGKVVKTGAGVFTLTGSNDYTGATEVLAGTLAIEGDAAVGEGERLVNGGAVRLAGGATYAKGWTLGANGGAIEVTAGGTAVLTGGVSGAGAFEKRGGGALVVSGEALAHTGATTVSGGLLEVRGALGSVAGGGGGEGGAGDGGAVYAGDITLAEGAELRFAQSGAQVLTGTVAGAGDLTKSGAGALTLAGASKEHGAGALTNSAGGGTGGGDGYGALTVEGSLRANSVANNAGATLAVGGALSTNGALTNAAGATLRAGELGVAGALANAGEISVAGDTRLGTGATFTNAAGAVFTGGALSGGARVENAAGASLRAQTVTLPAGGSLANAGEFAAGAVSAGGNFENAAGATALVGAVGAGGEGVAGDGSLRVEGTFVNAGEFRAASLTAGAGAENAEGGTVVTGSATARGYGLENYGTFTVAETFTGRVANHGTANLAASAAANFSAARVDGDIVSDGGLARVGDYSGAGTAGDGAGGAKAVVVTGSVSIANGGRVAANGSIGGALVVAAGGEFYAEGTGALALGALKNSGYVRFQNFGLKLAPSELTNADTSAAGHYELDLDFANWDNSDGFELAPNAPVSGRHVFHIRAVSGGEAVSRAKAAAGEYTLIRAVETTTNPATGETTRTFVAANIDSNAEISLASPVQAGLYTLDITGNGTAALSVVGYSAVGQTLVNTAGLLPSGWFSDTDNVGNHLADLRAGGSAGGSAGLRHAAGGGAGGGAGATADERGVTAFRPDSLDLYDTTPAPAHDWNAPAGNDFWLAAYAERLEADFGINGVGKTNQNQYGADVGYDHAFTIGSGAGSARLYVGVFAGYQSSDVKFENIHGAKSDTDAIAGGVYAAFANAAGWFANGIVKAQRFENETRALTYEYTTSVAAGAGSGFSGKMHDKFDYEALGIGISLAAGRRFALSRFWFAEPVLGLDYAHLSTDDYEAAGSTVKTSDLDIFRARVETRVGVGFEWARTWVQPYLKAGAHYQTSSGGTISCGDKLNPSLDGLRATLGAGLAWRLTPAHQLTLSYEATFGETYDKPWSISAGYRWRF